MLCRSAVRGTARHLIVEKDFGTKMSDVLIHMAAWGCKVTTSNLLFHERQNVGGCLLYKNLGGLFAQRL